MLYLVATSLLIVSAGFLSALWSGPGQVLDRVLLWLVLMPTVVTSETLVLGLLSQLKPGILVAVQATLACVSGLLWVWRSRHRRRQSVQPEHDQQGVKQALTCLRSPWLWPLVAAGAIAVGWQIYVGLLLPPYAWDALSYHLPPAVWWLQAGRIYPAPTQFTFGYGYPQGWSLLLLWQLAFTATDRLVNVVNLPFVLMGILASYGLARELGVGRRWAPWAAAFWGLAPLVLEQVTVPYNDVAVAALTITGFYFMLRFWRGKAERLSPLWAAGLCIGLILGIKANGFLILGTFGLLALLPVRKPFGAYLASALHRLVALAGPAVALSGYWYLRNLILYKNPLFPARITVLGRVLFPGPRTVTNLINVTPDQTTIKNLAYSLNEYVPRYTFDSPTAGFGPVFTCLGIGALAALVIHALMTRRWRMLLTMSAGLLVFLAQPFKYPRYILFLPALAGVALAYVLQHVVKGRYRAVIQATALVLLLYALFLVPFQPLLSPDNLRVAQTAARNGKPLAAAEFGLGRSYAFVESVPHLADPRNRIAYTEGSFVYPLMGRNRDLQVYYVPATKYPDWLATLLAKQTTFVVIGADDAVEAAWAAQHPDRFVVWARSAPFTVYLVRSDEARNQELLRVNPGDRW